MIAHQWESERDNFCANEQRNVQRTYYIITFISALVHALSPSELFNCTYESAPRCIFQLNFHFWIDSAMQTNSQGMCALNTNESHIFAIVTSFLLTFSFRFRSLFRCGHKRIFIIVVVVFSRIFCLCSWFGALFSTIISLHTRTRIRIE